MTDEVPMEIHLTEVPAEADQEMIEKHLSDMKVEFDEASDTV